MREYARNVVSAFAQACIEAEIPQPHLLSESGRALTAHHAVLIADVIGEERVSDQAPARQTRDDPQLDELWRVHDLLGEPLEPRELVEAWHGLLQAVSELHDRFIMGLADITRSEERRVGKECRSRGRTEYEKKKHNENLS